MQKLLFGLDNHYIVYKPQDCYNKTNLSKINLALQSCQNVFAYINFFSCPINLKFCTEHGSITAMLCAKSQNDWTTKIKIFCTCETWVRGQISCIATGNSDHCWCLEGPPRPPMFVPRGAFMNIHKPEQTLAAYWWQAGCYSDWVGKHADIKLMKYQDNCTQPLGRQ